MKWGSTELNITKDSYVPPVAGVQLNNIGILPGANNSNPASILQQGGRGRYAVTFDGFVQSHAEYETLRNDYLNLTARTFQGADNFSMSMIISEFKPTGRTLWPLRIWYSVTLMEA